MENYPLVSIALCTYNGATFLPEQLDTLLAQTYPHIEIVVVDDCSTDGTLEILTRYSQQYPQFKIFKNQENLGFVKNFEHAVTLCSGELIALCDQDDLWHPDKIEKQVAAIGSNELIYHNSEFVFADGASMGKKMSDVVNMYQGSDPLAFLLFNCVSGHSILMRKELADVALPLKGDFFHDFWLAYVATNLGGIAYLPNCLVKYRQHDRSDTNILRIARDKDKYKFTSVHRMERMQQWLTYCHDFTQNKDAGIVNSFYKAHTLRMRSYITFRFSFLLFKYRKSVFSTRKKSNISNFVYILKQVWGLKTKKMFN